MAKIKLRLISFTLIIMLLLTSVATPAAAVTESKKSLAVVNTDASTLMPLIDVLEDDFNSDQTDWVSEEGNVSTVSSLFQAPYSSYEGSRSLLAESNESGYVAVTKETKNLVSLRSTPIITLTVFVPESADGAVLTLCLITDDGDIKSSLSVEGGSWKTLFFDFSDKSADAVSQITVSVNNITSSEIYFLLDCIGGCAMAKSVFAAKYLSSVYSASGCNITQGENLTITFTSGEKYIEAVPVSSDFPDNSGIRATFKNSSTCSSVTFTATTADQKEISASYPISSGTVSMILPLPNEPISSFKIIFDQDTAGSIEIISMSAVECYSPKNFFGTVSQVKVGRDKKSITVSGSVSEEEFSSLQGSKLRLYELRLDQDVTDVSLSVSPILETEFSSASFELSIPIDSNRDRIFKKYAVAAVSSDGLVPIGEAKAVSNPEVFASEKVTLPESIKGSSYFGENYFLDGIAQTTVEVYADELLYLSEGSISYTDGGRKYSFSSEYVNYLDSVMKRHDIDGISVRFILRLRSPSDETASLSVHHPNNSGGTYSAFNVSSSSGINTLRAITSFLVNRYAVGGVSDNLFGIIVGSDVNDSFKSYNMGMTSLSETVTSYAAAFRTVYNTARMICSGFEVSLPVSSRWNKNDTASVLGSFEASSFLSSFATCISTTSDIEWSLSIDITPKRRKYSFEETNVDKTCTAKSITAANLEVVLSFLRQPAVKYNGVTRDLILAGMSQRDSFDSEDMKKLSAEYVYTYLRASAIEEIVSYIPSHPTDHEKVIRYIDTQLAAEKTAFAAELIGQDRLSKLLLNLNENTLRHFSATVSDGTMPQSVKGKVKLFVFSKGSDGFIPHVNCATAEGGVSYGETKALMRFRLSEAPIGSYGGVTVKLDELIDLSAAPYLTFNIRASALPDGVNELEAAVVVSSGRNTFVSTSRIHAGIDNTVVCDLSSFPNASTCDRISIYVRGVYGTDIGEPTLLVSAVSAASEKLSGTALRDAIYIRSDRVKVKLSTVIAVIICGALCITALTVRFVSAHKKRNENKG